MKQIECQHRADLAQPC